MAVLYICDKNRSVVMDTGMRDGKFNLTVGFKPHEEFMRGMCEQTMAFPKHGGNGYCRVYEFSSTPSIMDLMRFCGFSYENGVTAYNGVYIDAAAAKAPVNLYGRRFNVCMNCAETNISKE